ncbi:ABC transporter substrate-binding protein [Erysipelothrix sp. HDW6C]|uniref:ABC transporter substrate-binding protein n=1 Tax=Erysipelothrix sp. HDW6C TaxID=2714930 RepID=UPI00140CF0F5|nr:ABC transporter substrate-binding protein [Erysipelothrix sp. HDW6C]QIK70543.1 ABC transporter substrate-binding protein [Erysipelothrix sp. HDW6C]
MKKTIAIVLMMVLVLTGCASKEKSEFTVGVLNWGEHPALNASLDGMVKGLEEAGVSGRIKVEVKNANEDASNATIIASQFVSEKVDLIYAIATPSAQIALTAVEGTNIPVIFSAVSDAKAAGLVENIAKPEGNITGVSDLPPLEKQVKLMQEMLPEMKTIGILFNTSEVNSQNQIIEVKEIAQGLGLSVLEKGVSNASEIASAATQVATDSDALFIVNDNMIATATGLVVEQALKQNKPVFMAEDGQFDQGIFASDSVSYFNLGKIAGVMIKEILIDGKNIADIPVQTSDDTELSVSKEMAEKLGIEIPQSILERAAVR